MLTHHDDVDVSLLYPEEATGLDHLQQSALFHQLLAHRQQVALLSGGQQVTLLRRGQRRLKARRRVR